MTDFSQDAQARISKQVEELNEYIQREAAHRAVLMEAAAASQDRQRRMERAVAALTVVKKDQQPTKSKRKYVKGEKVDRILAALGEHGPTTAMFLSQVLELSDATIYTVLNDMRDQGRVRIAGVGEKKRNGANPPRLWAVMPSPAPDDMSDTRYEQQANA